MPQVVIDSLDRQQLGMTSRLGHATSLQHKYPEVGFNMHNMRIAAYCEKEG